MRILLFNIWIGNKYFIYSLPVSNFTVNSSIQSEKYFFWTGALAEVILGDSLKTLCTCNIQRCRGKKGKTMKTPHSQREVLPTLIKPCEEQWNNEMWRTTWGVRKQKPSKKMLDVLIFKYTFILWRTVQPHSLSGFLGIWFLCLCPRVHGIFRENGAFNWRPLVTGQFLARHVPTNIL